MAGSTGSVRDWTAPSCAMVTDSGSLPRLPVPLACTRDTCSPTVLKMAENRWRWGRRRGGQRGGGGSARSACPVLAVAARRAGALVSSRAVAPRGLPRGAAFRGPVRGPDAAAARQESAEGLRAPCGCACRLRMQRHYCVRQRCTSMRRRAVCAKCVCSAIVRTYMPGGYDSTTPPSAPVHTPGLPTPRASLLCTPTSCAQAPCAIPPCATTTIVAIVLLCSRCCDRTPGQCRRHGWGICLGLLPAHGAPLVCVLALH